MARTELEGSEEVKSNDRRSFLRTVAKAAAGVTSAGVASNLTISCGSNSEAGDGGCAGGLPGSTTVADVRASLLEAESDSGDWHAITDEAANITLSELRDAHSDAHSAHSRGEDFTHDYTDEVMADLTKIFSWQVSYTNSARMAALGGGSSVSWGVSEAQAGGGSGCCCCTPCCCNVAVSVKRSRIQ